MEISPFRHIRVVLCLYYREGRSKEIKQRKTKSDLKVYPLNTSQTRENINRSFVSY